ncbi:MAG TPA: nucleotide exchange factor GrpE [Elusimicrobiales bacterium]|nr:nucleotide exchange factor GrpE [Elusimicrobiales bacterium]
MESKKHNSKAHEPKKSAGADRPPELDCDCDENNECSCVEAAKGAPAGGGKPQAQADKPAPDYYAQLLGLKADFENYRKRIEKERPEFVKFGKAEILLKLLPLYDLLVQAHQHVLKLHNGGGEEAGQAQDIVKGLEMIFKEFTRVFDSEGIRPMEVVGKPYDPMASEIIGIDEGDAENDGLVTAEFQKGFYYGDKVLRPARVKVAKAKPGAPASPDAPAPDQSGKRD